MPTVNATELDLLVTAPIAMEDDMAAGDDTASEGDETEPADADLAEGEEEEAEEVAE